MHPHLRASVLSTLLALPLGAQITTTAPAGPLPDPGAPLPLPAAAIFVDAGASGANDGTSWQDAFTDLQDALASASSGDQVWIAAGTYVPAAPGGSRQATFQVPAGVELYGGFAGGETSLAQRDPATSVVTLSGDINGDDTYFPFNIGTGNSYHVLTVDAAGPRVLLDGVHVLAGHTGGGPVMTQPTGAGLWLVSGSVELQGCRFSYCVADQGGAVYVSPGASLVVANGTFQRNWASSFTGYGGAIYNGQASSCVVRDTLFESNQGEGRAGWASGGALYNDTGASLDVARCSFLSNQALNRLGGGPDIGRGGAIFNWFGSVLVESSTFVRNVSNDGGAVYGWGSSATTLRNCLFDHNDAIKYVLSGGFEGGGNGGGIFGDSGLGILGCLVYGGRADNYGGAYVGAGSVSCSIFWANTDGNGSIGTSQLKADLVEYCCVQNMLVGEPGEDPPDPADFPGSTAADPLLRAPLAGDFHLLAGSPCIDAGDNGAWPSSATTDLDGNPRFLDDPATPDSGAGSAPIVDMGPYEYGALPQVGLTAGWAEIGPGLAGERGIPSLRAASASGGGVTLTLAGAAPRRPAFLVLGRRAAWAALCGGVLVPAPDSVLGPFLTDQAGRATLELRAPLHERRAHGFVQAWILDPGSAGGLSASNGLQHAPR